jgi:hypothetical protein
MNLPFHDVFIDGFRGLQNLQLSELGDVNVLVGGNNSGKTSVLEAMSIACNPFEMHEWFAMIRRRDFGGLDETRLQSLRWCFRQSGELEDPDFLFEGKCEVRVDGTFSLRSLVAEYRDMYEMPSEEAIQRVQRRPGPIVRDLDFDEPWKGAEIVHYVETSESGSRSSSEIEPVLLQLWEHDRMMGRPYRPKKRGNLPTDTLTPYSYQLNRLQVRSQSNQLFSSRADALKGKEHVLELVREFDPDVLDIEIASFRGDRPALYLNHRRLGPAPISVFGDALRRAVLLSSTLPALKGGLLLIDEIETGIHVRALNRVFRWLVDVSRQFQVQVIATTHSLEALDAMASALDSREESFKVYHLTKEENYTHAKRFDGHEVHRLRFERGLDLR